MIDKLNNIRIAVTIEKSLNKLLKEEAEYHGVSVSKLVAQIIKHYLKNKQRINLD